MIAVFLWICVSSCAYVYLPPCLSVRYSLRAHLLVCPSARLSISLLVSPSVCPSTSQFVCLPVSLLVFLSVCLHICQSVCLYMCQCVWICVNWSDVFIESLQQNGYELIQRKTADKNPCREIRQTKLGSHTQQVRKTDYQTLIVYEIIEGLGFRV